jgi:short-subunit dehydrogenase
MKKALVTGANQGIGLEITKQLSRNGFDVFMGVRDLSKGEKAISEIGKKESLHLLSIDMGNIDSIESAIQDLKSKNRNSNRPSFGASGYFKINSV